MKAADYKAMIPENHSWCKAVKDSLGWEFIKQYMSRLSKTLLDMPEGSRLNILDERVVSAERRELFVKMAWLLMIDCKFPIDFFYTDTEFYIKKQDYKI
ncbi:MAG: hypothetical protein LBN27_12240 [Prevotellaceae bacterium]|jgi:hypothetical protein|nr:hypothetical protein [Prevotellaceae bacterium]